MMVLGIDPGTAITGWGIVSRDKSQNWKAVAYGAIKTTPDMEFPYRLRAIFRQLQQVIIQYKPEAVAIEQLFMGKNKKNTILVSHARGAAILAAVESDITVAEYTALQVKRALVGYGRAEKIQMQKMVKAFLNLEKLPKPDDVADALAVAICHISSARMNRFNKFGV